MKKGDRYRIFDNGGNYTHYAEMKTDSYLSIYTEGDDLVYTAGIPIGGGFYIYNTNGKVAFRAIIKDDQNFEIYPLEGSILMYTASLQ